MDDKTLKNTIEALERELHNLACRAAKAEQTESLLKRVTHLIAGLYLLVSTVVVLAAYAAAAITGIVS